MSEITLFGIPNCDTVKKARRWLDDQGIAYSFHNFKKQGVPADALDAWIKEFGLDKVVNRRGTTWRKLSDDQQSLLEVDSSQAQALLQQEPSMIKRPILQGGSVTLLGFDADIWGKMLQNAQ